MSLILLNGYFLKPSYHQPVIGSSVQAVEISIGPCVFFKCVIFVFLIWISDAFCAVIGDDRQNQFCVSSPQPFQILFGNRGKFFGFGKAASSFWRMKGARPGNFSSVNLSMCDDLNRVLGLYVDPASYGEISVVRVLFSDSVVSEAIHGERQSACGNGRRFAWLLTSNTISAGCFLALWFADSYRPMVAVTADHGYHEIFSKFIITERLSLFKNRFVSMISNNGRHLSYPGSEKQQPYVPSKLCHGQDPPPSGRSSSFPGLRQIYLGPGTKSPDAPFGRQPLSPEVPRSAPVLFSAVSRWCRASSQWFC